MLRPTALPTRSDQESVWDYPRPPRLEAVPPKLGTFDAKILSVEFNGVTLAQTQRGYRVLETSHPPVYYFPPEDVRTDLLHSAASNASNCEWKGQAKYFDALIDGRRAAQVAWSYAEPDQAFASIRGYFAFYAGRVDACYVDDELVIPQPGDFYGGWITRDIVGPFKGGPGSWGW